VEELNLPLDQQRRRRRAQRLRFKLKDVYSRVVANDHGGGALPSKLAAWADRAQARKEGGNGGGNGYEGRDGNEDGTSMAESAEMEAALARDLDGQRLLTATGVQQCVEMLGGSLSPSEAQRILKMVDVNADALISYDEFLVGVQPEIPTDELVQHQQLKERMAFLFQDAEEKLAVEKRSLAELVTSLGLEEKQLPPPVAKEPVWSKMCLPDKWRPQPWRGTGGREVKPGQEQVKYHRQPGHGSEPKSLPHSRIGGGVDGGGGDAAEEAAWASDRASMLQAEATAQAQAEQQQAQAAAEKAAQEAAAQRALEDERAYSEVGDTLEDLARAMATRGIGGNKSSNSNSSSGSGGIGGSNSSSGSSSGSGSGAAPELAGISRGGGSSSSSSASSGGSKARKRGSVFSLDQLESLAALGVSEEDADAKAAHLFAQLQREQEAEGTGGGSSGGGFKATAGRRASMVEALGDDSMEAWERKFYEEAMKSAQAEEAPSTGSSSTAPPPLLSTGPPKVSRDRSMRESILFSHIGGDGDDEGQGGGAGGGGDEAIMEALHRQRLQEAGDDDDEGEDSRSRRDDRSQDDSNHRNVGGGKKDDDDDEEEEEEEEENPFADDLSDNGDDDDADQRATPSVGLEVRGLQRATSGRASILLGGLIDQETDDEGEDNDGEGDDGGGAAMATERSPEKKDMAGADTTESEVPGGSPTPSSPGGGSSATDDNSADGAGSPKASGPGGGDWTDEEDEEKGEGFSGGRKFSDDSGGEFDPPP